MAGDPGASGPASVFLQVPTGAGKTAAAVLYWLWNRCAHPDAAHRALWPRRLVYCLPMRVLVEQTADSISTWVRNAKLEDQVRVHVLMGGEEASSWDEHPEREAVLIGTQDMLISRALNRGYAMSRFRWPIQFGLLNNDCLWVLDEVQLMSSGLASTTQMQAFRRVVGVSGRVASLWMSATIEPEWLHTVDFDARADLQRTVRLEPSDANDPELGRRLRATKRCRSATSHMGGDAEPLAREVIAHHRPGTRTLVVINTVRRAVELFDALAGLEPAARVLLLHSRFRPGDRRRATADALAAPGDAGAIVVSTQVIEAGVDLTSSTLFTELAPWASLVQRFGRCNREGLDADAQVFWIDVPGDVRLESDSPAVRKLAAPYAREELFAAREILMRSDDVGSQGLARNNIKLPYMHSYVVRRSDLLQLFDTTPDLGGNDVDVSRYVRDVSDTDVAVFWRELGAAAPTTDEPMPGRDELCPVSIGSFKDFSERLARNGLRTYKWDYLRERWTAATRTEIYPGQTYLIDASAGGYDAVRGWTAEISGDHVAPVEVATMAPDKHSTDREHGPWQTIAEHTDDVCRELDLIIATIPLEAHEREALRTAARWHDRGKAHSCFQAAVPTDTAHPAGAWGKWPSGSPRYPRRYFRHELASALAVLQVSKALIALELKDLAAYLVAAHHGKVRGSIRSLPNETPPPDGRRFARGVHDGDVLPETDLGGGVRAESCAVSLEPMELGLSEAGNPSWSERVLRLRENQRVGPFRLAYLEALLRAADMRASALAARGAADPGNA